MVIYETAIVYTDGNDFTEYNQWKTKDAAYLYFKIATKRENCLFASVYSKKSDGADHFNKYNPIAEYASGCEIINHKEEKYDKF